MTSSFTQKYCKGKASIELKVLRDQRAEGIKTLGYHCCSFPPALAAGLGLRPLRLLCGTSPDSESAGEKIVRADVCPLVKSLLGNVAEGKDLHADVDLWVGLYTCDQMRRGLSCLSEQLGKKVHPIQLPATRTPEAAEYYVLQIKRFVADIEAAYGVSFCGAHALKWLHAEEQAAAVLVRAAYSGAITPPDLHAMFHLYFVARPFGLAEFFEEVLSSAGGFHPTKTVVLTGSPITREDRFLIEELEARGIGVVPLNCTGLNSVEYRETIADGDDVVSSLARSAFYRPACIRTRPNREVYERIGETLSDTGASGLIVKCLKFCDQWYTERERMKRTFDLPVLVYDSDYAAGDRERQLSRVDAFLEMI